jgi:hypothetical protein
LLTDTPPFNPILFSLKIDMIENDEDECESTESGDDPTTIVYRIDNFINRESFYSYWKTKCDALINQKIALSRELSPLNEHNHHLSNKEIGTANYERTLADEQLEQQNETMNNESTAAFRFAGLFFKKNSMSASKPTSLKRAKSGIQLERKKIFNNTGLKGKAVADIPTEAKPR